MDGMINQENATGHPMIEFNWDAFVEEFIRRLLSSKAAPTNYIDDNMTAFAYSNMDSIDSIYTFTAWNLVGRSTFSGFHGFLTEHCARGVGCIVYPVRPRPIHYLGYGDANMLAQGSAIHFPHRSHNELADALSRVGPSIFVDTETLKCGIVRLVTTGTNSIVVGEDENDFFWRNELDVVFVASRLVQLFLGST